MARPFATLDEWGSAWRENNEGFPEDRCGVCDRPMIDHVGHGGSESAKWPHRRAALWSILFDGWR